MLFNNQTFESNARRILIVDCDATTRELLAQVLKANGFQVGEGGSPEEALAFLEHKHFNGVFFRFPLSKMSDENLISSTRRMAPETLIVIHDSHPTLDRILVAVKAGVADYQTGPWDTKKVAQGVVDAFHRQYERIRRLTRHVSQAIEAYYSMPGGKLEIGANMAGEMGSTLTAGDMQLIRLSRTLTSLGEVNAVVKLTKGESDVLAVLMGHPGEAMSCWAIAREAWGYDMLDIEAKSVVRPNISRLRRKLRDNSFDPAIITTVYGLGYVFLPPPLANLKDEETQD